MTNWSCEPIFESYATVAVLAASLILVLWVRPSFRELAPARRRTLLLLRGLVALLVILAMLRPTYIRSRTTPQTAVLLVLFDQSRSMQLPNASEAKSRWDAQLETLRAIEPLLEELDEDLEVIVHSYDFHLRSLAWKDGELVLPAEAEGEQTDIGSSLHEALRRERGKRLVGVVLMGDGTQTAYQPTVEIYDAARELANMGCPLYTVSYGPAADTAQSRDVAVENLPEQYTVFVKKKLVVRGLIRVRGYVNKEIPVRLTVEDAKGAKTTVGPVSVQADQDNQQLDVSLTFVPELPGQYKLTLEAEQQSGELVTRNNQLTAFLTVREGGLRILYFEGELRQEQKFIRWALGSSPDIDLDFQWLPRRLRDNWPVELGDTFETGDYDAYILGDVDVRALGKDNLQKLADEVNRGKGLIALGGYHSFGPGGYRDSPLADLLPIEMQLARQEFDQPDIEKWHVPGPLPMVPVRNHPVTLLASPSENERVWQLLPPLKGANRWAGVRQAIGVQLLAETPDHIPLLVASDSASGGRVLAFAGDSTWQWWRKGARDIHQRFWRQIVLWLARRDDVTRHDVWIDLAQRRFPAGSRVTFKAGARTAMGDVIRTATLAATYIDSTGLARPVPLAADGNHFVGTIDPVTQPGSARIEVVATSVEGQSLGQTTTHLEIMDQDVELSNPAADPDQMARLANLTRRDNGGVVDPGELIGLLQKMKSNPPQLAEKTLSKRQLADHWWDAWLALICLVSLLATEWFLRKRWGLV